VGESWGGERVVVQGGRRREGGVGGRERRGGGGGEGGRVGAVGASERPKARSAGLAERMKESEEGLTVLRSIVRERSEKAERERRSPSFRERNDRVGRR